MRNAVLLFASLLLAAGASAQDQAAPRNGGGSAFFGGPAVKFTMLRDQGAGMIGGLVGWKLGPSWTIGASGYGTFNGVDGPDGVVPYAPGPLDVTFETFGVDLGYRSRPQARTQLTLCATIGGGAGHYVKDDSKEQHGETDFMLLLEPSVGVERTVTGWLAVNLGLSYRLVSGVEQVGLKTGDFAGPSASLSFKIGHF